MAKQETQRNPSPPRHHSLRVRSVTGPSFVHPFKPSPEMEKLWREMSRPDENGSPFPLFLIHAL